MYVKLIYMGHINHLLYV